MRQVPQEEGLWAKGGPQSVLNPNYKDRPRNWHGRWVRRYQTLVGRPLICNNVDEWISGNEKV